MRERAVGNAFHSSFTTSALSNWDPVSLEREVQVMPVIQEQYVTSLEKELRGKTQEQFDAWMKERLQGHVAPELSLKVKKDETVPSQVPPRERYARPQKLHKAAMEAIKEKLRLGSMRLIKYDYKQWVSHMFIKGKGRVDPETQEEAVRFLTDFRAVNGALE